MYKRMTPNTSKKNKKQNETKNTDIHLAKIDINQKIP